MQFNTCHTVRDKRLSFNTWKQVPRCSGQATTTQMLAPSSFGEWGVDWLHVACHSLARQLVSTDSHQNPQPCLWHDGACRGSLWFSSGPWIPILIWIPPPDHGFQLNSNLDPEFRLRAPSRQGKIRTVISSCRKNGPPISSPNFDHWRATLSICCHSWSKKTPKIYQTVAKSSFSEMWFVQPPHTHMRTCWFFAIPITPRSDQKTFQNVTPNKEAQKAYIQSPSLWKREPNMGEKDAPNQSSSRGPILGPWPRCAHVCPKWCSRVPNLYPIHAKLEKLFLKPGSQAHLGGTENTCRKTLSPLVKSHNKHGGCGFGSSCDSG